MADADSPEKGSKSSQKSAAPGLMNGRYRIELAKPLVHLSSPCADAYDVTDLKEGPAELYALVHHQGSTHRGDVLAELIEAPVISMLNPVRSSVIRVKAGGPRHLVSLVQAPKGPSLAEIAAQHPISGHKLRKLIVPGIVQALAGLHSRGIVHRSIRPETIFFKSPALDGVVLGECFSCPPAAGQPAHFEPLERALAMPFGRGEATPEADMFALGATLLACHLGVNKKPAKDPNALHAARMAQGSFWAHSAGTEVPGVTGTLLRGLLNDDEGERWTLKELNLWLESSVPNRRSVNVLWTFARPVIFRQATFSDRRMLAHEFSQHPLDAAHFLRQVDFPSWVQNMITTELFSERLERLINVKKDGDLSSERHGDHALVARVTAHLDPLGPLRYNGISTTIDGLGPAMVDIFNKDDDMEQDILLHLFDSNVLPAILDIIIDRNPVVSKQHQLHSHTVQLMRRTKGRMALICALYDLNPTLQCLSPALKDLWITSPQQLLKALDRIVDKSSELSPLLDDHVLAMFCSRVEGAEPLVEALIKHRKSPVRLMTAVTKLLAFLQQRLDSGPLKNLSGHLVKSLKALLGDVKSRSRKRTIMARLDELGDLGSLPDIARAIDLEYLKYLDHQEFLEAQRKVSVLEQMIRKMRRPVHPSEPNARLAGFRAASAMGWLVLMVTMIVLTMGAG
ncbi:hypothetical protein JCM17845_00710 [Iodidimonas gelatinilytica]|uniref:Protein kinase domain-containing protein n=2 Tax=Iodidimonas gelatinilytica TaxID=1236966 RepID=A0A5A7MU70_9PROT|nr:protein kinase family protein [Iodidimonas gelatinilytica]GEQ99447.1 hypothetical protein JCM17845_00710 [Iodidimonas gelatinilytica]